MTGAIRDALYGAWRLLVFDASGIQRFEPGLAAARFSFVAALLLLPFDLLALALDAGRFPEGRLLLVFIIAYVCSWALFPLAMRAVARLFGRLPLWPRLIAASNWARVCQTAIVLPALALGTSGLVDDGAAASLFQTLWLATLVYEVYVIRTALAVGVFTAFSCTFLDVVLQLFLSGWMRSLVS